MHDLEDAFDYFEKYKQLPVVMIGEKENTSLMVLPKPEKKEKPAKKS